MLQFRSALLCAAGQFVGKYTPYESIHIQPHDGGILVASTDGGKISFLGYDPDGRGQETCSIVASQKLLDACAGIKSAEREVQLRDGTASVITYRKIASNEVKTFPYVHASTPFPPLQRAVSACIQRWSAAPAVGSTAGRYSSEYLLRAIRSAGFHSDSIVLSAFDGGPLRLHCEGMEMLILVMPQAAAPIPPLPQWVQTYAAQPAVT